MADPTKFVPGFDYSDFEQNNPTLPKPGAQLDNDFANVKQTTDQTIDALKQIRRSDGALKNGIVTPDSLSPGLIIGVETPQAWQTGVEYGPPDAVFISSGVNQGIYRATVIHTSTTFAADLAAGKWELIFNLTAAGLSTVALTGEYADLLNKPFTVPAGGTTGQTLVKTSNAGGAYSWQNPPGGGDMLSSVYDPQGKSADAFARGNHTGTQDVSTITAAPGLVGRFTAGVGPIEALTQAQARQAIGGWEPIGSAISLAGLANVDWTNLDAFRILRIEGSGQTNTGAGTSALFSRLSENNTDFPNNAGDYNASYFGNEGSVVSGTAEAQQTYAPIIVPTNTLIAAGFFEFHITWHNFNKAGLYKTFNAQCVYTKAAGIRRMDFNYGYRTATANAQKAIRFGAGGGTPFANGLVQLTGIRG